MKALILLSLALLEVGAVQAQVSKNSDFARVRRQPKYVAKDGSVSRLQHKGGARQPDSMFSISPVAKGFQFAVVADDAGGCVPFHSVRHRIHRDTVVVTVFNDAPQECSAVYTPVISTVTVTGLRPGRYQARIFLESAGGRGSEASGASAWRTIAVQVR